jgi:DNA primase
VEGEFNALSLAKVTLALDVVSPGGAGDFYSKTAENYLRNMSTYETIYLVVDDDKAGAQAAIQAASKLKVYGAKDVRIKLVEKDFNDELVEKGPESLKEKVREMGMPIGEV